MSMSLADHPLTPVSSSNLAAVGYDPVERTLLVEFRRTGRYAYDGVPPALYRAFLAAPSLGTFFAAEIRNAYPHRRLENPLSCPTPASSSSPEPTPSSTP